MAPSEPVGPPDGAESGPPEGSTSSSGELQHTPELPTGPLLDNVCELACQLLDVARAGVWLLEAGGERLRRVHLYDHATGSHRPGPGLLKRSRFPAYFAALEEADGTLTVSDAQSDERVGSLYEVYGRPQGIRTWIDCPIPAEDGIAGTLRLEETGGARDWTGRERRVTRALGALLARSGALTANREPENGSRSGDPSRAGDGTPRMNDSEGSEGPDRPETPDRADSTDDGGDVPVRADVPESADGSDRADTSDREDLSERAGISDRPAGGPSGRESPAPSGSASRGPDRPGPAETTGSGEADGAGAGQGDGIDEELFDRLPSGIVLTDPDGKIVRCNSALADILGYESRRELVGRSIHHIHAFERDRRQLLTALRRRDRVTSQGYEGRTRSGDRVWLLENAVLLDAAAAAAFGGGGEGHVLSAIMDATRIKRRQAKLEEQAYRDPLTGLANRRFLRETVHQTLALAERHGRQLALAYLDLSDFKAINDRLGHEVGDEVLRVAGQRIVEGVRDSDLVSRIGGDEFVILFTEVEGTEGAREVSRRMLERFRAPIRVHGHELRISADVGLALFPDHGEEVDQLLRRADVAMYRAKRADGDHIRVYRSEAAAPAGLGAGTDGRREPEEPDRRAGEPETAPAGAEPAGTVPPGGREASAAPVRTPVTEEGVREALEEGRLELRYQPVYRLSAGETAGAEALLRWDHPQAGLLPAADFVSLVEDPNLLRALDRWALEAAVRQLAEWRADRPSFFLSVNVGPWSLDGLPLFLDGLFGRHRVDPNRLVVEVVIDSASADVAGLAGKLAFLKGTGCRIALDLGPEPEELTPFLRDVAADMIKLDVSYVARKPGAAITDPLLAPGDGRETELLVKRVETEEQYRTARERVATMAQGFFWSHAVPAEDLRAA